MSKKPSKETTTTPKKVRYTKSLGEFIAQKVEDGMSVKEVVKKYPDKCPAYRSIWRWRRDKEEFAKLLDTAYESYVMSKIDELEEISKEKTPVGLEKTEIMAYNNDKRARIDVLKFTIAKTAALLNRRFDTKQTIKHEGDNIGAPQIVIQSYCTAEDKGNIIDSNPTNRLTDGND